MGILDLFNKKSYDSKIEWKKLETSSDLSQLNELSSSAPQMIFKHSTSCSISSMALNRIQEQWDTNLKITPHYLDLLRFREISNNIESIYSIKHESPQVLIIKDGKCIYHNSHNGIRVDEIKANI